MIDPLEPESQRIMQDVLLDGMLGQKHLGIS